MRTIQVTKNAIGDFLGYGRSPLSKDTYWRAEVRSVPTSDGSGVTSIQIHEKVKQEFDILKENKKESYKDVIARLIENFEKQKRLQSELLVKGYQEMAKESLKVTKEWSTADKDWD